jgi:hypothetical protein
VPNLIIAGGQVQLPSKFRLPRRSPSRPLKRAKLCLCQLFQKLSTASESRRNPTRAMQPSQASADATSSNSPTAARPRVQLSDLATEIKDKIAQQCHAADLAERVHLYRRQLAKHLQLYKCSIKALCTVLRVEDFMCPVQA